MAAGVLTEARNANRRTIMPEMAIERLFMRPCSFGFSREIAEYYHDVSELAIKIS
jgi:hypothetical protein